MSCWEILGLDTKADERTIKRQYARLLKSTRPDEDPEAFQALREAYEQAQRWAQWRVENARDDEAVAEAEDHADADADADAGVAMQAELDTARPAELAAFQRSEVRMQPLADLPAFAPVPVDDASRKLPELLAGLRPSLLTERRQQAEAAGLGVAFERGVLRRCLDEEYDSSLRDAACSEYRWLELIEHPRLTAAELQPLYARIVDVHLLSLRALHNHGEPEALADGLRTLANQPWLQSYDGRALLEGAVVSMLLEMPAWSCQTLDQVASVFAWKEGQRDANCPDHQWRELLERWDAERFYGRTLDNASRWELAPECRAARLVLAPLDRLQRRRFMADFGDEERQHSTTIARAFIYRYPQLLERLPGAPLDEDFWYDLARSGPILKRALKLWFGFLIMYVCIYVQEGKKFDPVLIFIGVPVASAVLAAALDKLLLLFDSTLRHDVRKFDYWLSSKLPSSWHQYGVGLRPIRDGMVSYLMAMGAGAWAGLSFPSLFWQALVIAPVALAAMQILRRSNILGRLNLFLGGLWSRHRQYLHIAIFLCIGLMVVAAMVFKSSNEVKPRYQTEAEIALYCQEAKNHGDIRCVLRDAANPPPATGK